MSRELLNIEVFNKGVVTAISDEDANDAVATWGTVDVDPEAVDGTIRGRKGDSAITSPTPAYGIENVHATMQNVDSTVDVVYKSGDAIRQCLNFPTGTDSQLLADLDNIKCMPIFGRSVRAGGWSSTSGHIPRWIGEPNKQFGATPSAGRTVAYAQMETANGVYGASCYVVDADPSATTGGGLEEDAVYQWDVAFEFDGFQVAPLRGLPQTGGAITTTRVADIDLSILLFAQISPRVTAVLLFRRKVASGVFDQFVFAKRIDINNAGWTTSSTAKIITVTDMGETGLSFDDYAGFSETLTCSFVNYRLACTVNGILVVGQCNFLAGDLPDDAPFMLFRSNVNRPDTFNWITYFCRLPNYPTALASFQNRAYAFDSSHLYRINPITMALEDKIDGVGCLGQDSVMANEYGMFFADANSIYAHNGSELVPIGAPITNQWREVVTSSSVISVRFHAQTKSVFFCVHGSSPVIFSYSIDRKRWDYYQVDFTGIDNKSCIVGANGTLYMFKNNSSATSGVSLGTSSTRKGWTYITKNFTMETPTQYKRLYGISAKVRSGAVPTVSWSIDGGAYTTALAIGQMAKAVRVKLVAAADSTVEAVSILYRRLIGLR